MKRSMRGVLKKLAIVFAVVVVADQIVQYAALGDGEFLGSRIAPFDPPLFTPNHRRTVERMRAHESLEGVDFDSELGWSPPKEGGGGRYSFDWSGSRIASAPLARSRTPGTKRIVTIGCSFTFGAEVDPLDGWAARLDALPTVEVANLGMGAYGLDQALLRYERDGVPLEGDEVWLGWLPSASLRPLTMYMPAMRHWAWSPAFKPRFELADHDELVLVPNPARTPDEFVALVDSNARFLAAIGDHDMWVKRAPAAYAPFGASVWHRSALARIALTWYEHQGRDPRPFVLDTKSECHRLIRALVLRTKRESESHGARFRLVVLPDQQDLSHREADGGEYWSALVSEWKAEHVEVIDVTNALRAANAATNSVYWAPEGHYSAEGNRVVAEALAPFATETR